MSFETLYEKYMNGTASEEERVYVEEEIAKARKLGEILEAAEKDKAKSASPSDGADGENVCLAPEDILEDADAEQVKKSKKTAQNTFVGAGASDFAGFRNRCGGRRNGRRYRHGDGSGEKTDENFGNAGENDCSGILFGELRFVGSDGGRLHQRF